jgi:alcohol dehydrogenase class IV
VDSFTHALEAFVSKRANPFSDALALAAMDLIGKNIRTAYAEPNNHAAREAMMIGATRPGWRFPTARWRWCTACRGRSARISTCRTDCPTRCCCRRSRGFPFMAPRPATLRRRGSSGFASASDSDPVAAAKLVSGLETLNQDLSVPTPSGFGIQEADWNGKMALMAEQALASGSPNNNPRVPNASEIVALTGPCGPGHRSISSGQRLRHGSSQAA